MNHRHRDVTFIMTADAESEPQRESAGVAVAEPEAPPRAKPTRQPTPVQPKKLPPYQVVLENDDDHTVEYVVEMLQRVCGHAKPTAYKLAMEVHFRGQAAVWTGSKEVAELKRDQIRGYGPDFYASAVVRYPLGVRIEPMPG